MRTLKIDKSITHRDHDTLMRYLQDIKKYPLLTGDEETKLALKIKEGDQAALNRLVNSNLRFVISVAKKYEGQGILLPDLIAEGNAGLMKAAARFDAAKGFKFISFAVWWVRQSIMFAINEYKRMVRLPGNRIVELNEVWKAEQELEQKLERAATLEELVEYTELSPDKVRASYTSGSYTSSLDDMDLEADRPGMLAVLEDTMFAPADAGLEQADLAAELNSVLSSLPNRQREILRLNYGLDGKTAMFVDDIAIFLGVSSQCILMNRAKGLETLRNNKKVKHLQAYLGF
ncbi:MAG TPA: RNA polymerase sigma factor RpoD/SigA [Pedobacter sp.]|uniref:sigma-70 family RNA polymerase sigma factor n=1 Tax=Pedobacter sp. TaxID=1411316 RepID=UPI002CBA2640|nr:RNA polymerase sigma factor RpoD/SigA [Pedobacter sp.]HMI04402.1 RNA polymerase sigma factor RpoD/SigA [Pedobacter sp.]